MRGTNESDMQMSFSWYLFFVVVKKIIENRYE